MERTIGGGIREFITVCEERSYMAICRIVEGSAGMKVGISQDERGSWASRPMES